MTLDELEALAKKATPGPWIASAQGNVFAKNGGRTPGLSGPIVADCYDGGDPHDADLIVAMRNALPALIAAIRAADAMRTAFMPLSVSNGEHAAADRFSAVLDYDAKRREVEA